MKNISILFVLFLAFLNNGVIAQQNLQVDYTASKDSVLFTFRNNSTDTLFLFSTYLSKDFLSSKYLHQINKSKKTYTISFIPLLPYLSAYLTDRIVLGEDKIITSGQNIFRFIILRPNSSFEMKLNINDIFSNIDKKKNVVKAYTENELRKKKFKFSTCNLNQSKYNLAFEFAFYRDIGVLISKEQYINAGDNVFFKAREYEVVKLKANLQIFK